MCMGGKKVKSADAFYQEMKPDYGQLPSLSMNSQGRKPQDKPKYEPTRTGAARRSLLGMTP